MHHLVGEDLAGILCDGDNDANSCLVEHHQVMQLISAKAACTTSAVSTAAGEQRQDTHALPTRELMHKFQRDFSANLGK